MNQKPFENIAKLLENVRDLLIHHQLLEAKKTEAKVRTLIMAHTAKPAVTPASRGHGEKKLKAAKEWKERTLANAREKQK